MFYKKRFEEIRKFCEDTNNRVYDLTRTLSTLIDENTKLKSRVRDLEIDKYESILKDHDDNGYLMLRKMFVKNVLRPEEYLKLIKKECEVYVNEKN